jgi:hypothetical protein
MTIGQYKEAFINYGQLGYYLGKCAIFYLYQIYFCPLFPSFIRKKAAFGHFPRICMGPENLKWPFSGTKNRLTLVLKLNFVFESDHFLVSQFSSF